MLFLFAAVIAVVTHSHFRHLELPHSERPRRAHASELLLFAALLLVHVRMWQSRMVSSPPSRTSLLTYTRRVVASTIRVVPYVPQQSL